MEFVNGIHRAQSEDCRTARNASCETGRDREKNINKFQLKILK